MGVSAWGRKNPIESLSVSTRAPKSFDELRAENARLKHLVVTLSSLVLRQIVHEFRGDVHGLSKESADPHAKVEDERIAEALEVAGHELMAKAVEMKAILLKRERR